MAIACFLIDNSILQILLRADLQVQMHDQQEAADLLIRRCIQGPFELIVPVPLILEFFGFGPPKIDSLKTDLRSEIERAPSPLILVS